MPSPEETFISHGDHQIACLSYRNTKANEKLRLPVVWVHGLTMSVRFWEKAMFSPIEEERSWYSVGLPLHYPSSFEGPLTPDTLTEDLFAELMHAAIEELIPGTGKVHLVGHSLGGFAVLNCAAKFPDRIASVVCVGGFMRGRSKGIEGALQFLSKGEFIRKGLFHLAVKILRSRFVFLKAVGYTYGRKWRAMRGNDLVESTLRHVYPDFRQHSVAAMRAFCRYLLDMDLLDELDHMATPVLMMVGEKDPIIPSEHQITCALRLHESKLVLFEGAGHLAFAEDYDLFEKELLEWLEKHDEV